MTGVQTCALPILLHEDQEKAIQLAVESLDDFRRQYSAAWAAGMKAKLGFREGLQDDVTWPLIEELLGLLQDGHVDYTSIFRSLGKAARAGRFAKAAEDRGVVDVSVLKETQKLLDEGPGHVVLEPFTESKLRLHARRPGRTVLPAEIIQ